MILHENKVWIIDFGLGFISTRNEDKAVDLHLMKQALESKHFLHCNEYFKKIIEGYRIYDNSTAVLKQFEKVEERGRYKRKMHK